MKIAKLEGNQVKPRCLTFEEAQAIAEENGWWDLNGFLAFKKTMPVMPRWYHQGPHMWEQAYVQDIETKLTWEAQQKRIPEAAE